jgi:SAM-dependent methyltransferase
MSDLPEHVLRNRAYWDVNAKNYVAPAERHWVQPEPTWGIWGIPESEIGLFPTELDGKDAIELGCGTAYVSSWMVRRGALVVGIDNSEVQLQTAHRMQQEHGMEFPLIHGNAESVPYPDASFDFAVSEYGASLWADPYAWIPEAARLLRPGGRLSFLTNAYVLMLCMPDVDGEAATNEMVRSAFGMHRFEWPDDDGVEFHLSHGDWIRLFGSCGFEVEDLIELQPAEDAYSRYPFATLEWARQWPSEEVWKVRKR